MRFITVLPRDKALYFIDNLELSNNLIFDFPEDLISDIKTKLEDLTGLDTIPVAGIVCSDNNVMKGIWDDVSASLPVKPSDVVFQFNLPDDQLLVGEFNSVMAFLYFPSDKSYDDVFHYEVTGSEKCVALVNRISSDSFEAAYLLDENWQESTLSGNRINDIGELKSLCKTTVFGG